MLPARRSSGAARAGVFAALGDETRLKLLRQLYGGERRSIAELTAGAGAGKDGALTRQAITKHLRVLERARLVHASRVGRERLFAFDPEPMLGLREYLERVSAEWDGALGRLKAFVER
jgi:DNA-binding transcriptional ArsR family regulator